MSCRYKEECPSYSGWCERPKQDFSKCVEFLITTYETEKRKKASVEIEGHEVRVVDEDHIWIGGNQFISLNRFMTLKNDMNRELNGHIKRVKELTEENDALKVLLKNKLMKEE